MAPRLQRNAVTLSLAAEPEDTVPMDQALHFYNPPAAAAAKLPFSHAVRVGDILYLSGALGNVRGTRALVPGGIETETRQGNPRCAPQPNPALPYAHAATDPHVHPAGCARASARARKICDAAAANAHSTGISTMAPSSEKISWLPAPNPRRNRA